MSAIKRIGAIWNDICESVQLRESSDGEYVKWEDYTELQAECAALAAENVALKNFSWSEVVAADQEKEDRWMMECTGARDRFISMQTPATDAYLNSVRAEGVEALTKILQVMIDAGDFDGDEVGAITGAIDAGNYHAAQLRAGDPS